MNITPENVLSAEHETWLKHPVTVQMIKLLDKQFANHADSIAAGAFVTEDSNKVKKAVALNTVKSIRSYITNTNKFVELSKQ